MESLFSRRTGRPTLAGSKRPLRAFLPVYRQERASSFFLPSLSFLSRLLFFLFHIYIFFSFFPLFSIERHVGKEERVQKEKNREGQEREAVKRSVYTRLRIYFIAASLVRPSRRARPLARSELGLIKT